MICKFCKCSDDRACPGGCFWVKPHVCSTCLDMQTEQIADAAQAVWNVRRKDRWPGAIGGRTCEIVSTKTSLTVFDHLGTIAFAMSADGIYLAPQYDPRELMPLFEKKAYAA